MGLLLLINESRCMKHDSMVSRYAIPIGIPQVDSWSTGPPGFRASQYQIEKWWINEITFLTKKMYSIKPLCTQNFSFSGPFNLFLLLFFFFSYNYFLEL